MERPGCLLRERRGAGSVSAGGDRQRGIGQTVARFVQDDHGSVTIEFVLWMPLFSLLLMIAADASLMYLTMTRMENVARDAARRVSMGQLSPATVAGHVAGQLSGPYSASAACTTAELACVQISRPVDSVITFAVFGPLIGQSVGTRTMIRLEPDVTL